LNANVLELGLVELQELQKWPEVVDDVVKEKVNKILVEVRQITQGSVTQALMEVASTSRYQFGQHINVD
jgi:hydrogenase maturation factor